jgi:hypothetical protein
LPGYFQQESSHRSHLTAIKLANVSKERQLSKPILPQLIRHFIRSHLIIAIDNFDHMRYYLSTAFLLTGWTK